jgi:hypothetical protein
MAGRKATSLPGNGLPRPPAQPPRRRSAPPAATGAAGLVSGRAPMEIDRAQPKRSSSAPLSPTTVPKQKKVKGRARSASPVPSRQPKQVQDVRCAVRLNVLNDYSSQRAADEANAASASIKAGLSAKITKSDVERYGKEYRDAVVADLALSSARINLDRALRVARRDESVPEVQIARGIFENIESSTKQRIGKAIDKLQLKRPGNPKFSEARVFTDNEEEVMAEIISQMSRCGFPFGYRKSLRTSRRRARRRSTSSCSRSSYL